MSEVASELLFRPTFYACRSCLSRCVSLSLLIAAAPLPQPLVAMGLGVSHRTAAFIVLVAVVMAAVLVVWRGEGRVHREWQAVVDAAIANGALEADARETLLAAARSHRALVSPSSSSPLHIAVALNQTTIFAMLLKNGGDLDARDEVRCLWAWARCCCRVCER